MKTKTQIKTAIVSPFLPSKGGVAEAYTNYLFKELKKLDNETYVLADKIDKPVKEDKNIIRCWDHSPVYFYQLIKEVIKRKIKRVHIQQELHIFGGLITVLLLPLLILLLRILRREVIITLHGVVPLKDINQEFVKENGYSGSPLIIKNILRIVYFVICLFPNKIIVHDYKFKQSLQEDYFVSFKDISVTGIGIDDTISLIPKDKARKKLEINNNKYTFLYFGYVTGYKGIELIIDALKSMKDNDFNFIIVGSEHPRRKNEPQYKDYYNKIKGYFQKDKRCHFTGYVPEEEVNYYFRASDCLVLPYTAHISSSGPMAQAISNEILVIGSDAFEGVLPSELVFKRNRESLAKLLKKAKEGKLQNQLAYVKKTKTNLSWKNIAKKTMEIYKK